MAGIANIKPLTFQLPKGYRLLIFLLDNQRDFVTNSYTKMATRFNTTYNFLRDTIVYFESIGIVEIEKYKRERRITITEKGIEIASRLRSVYDTLYNKEYEEQIRGYRNDSAKHKRINQTKE